MVAYLNNPELSGYLKIKIFFYFEDSDKVETKTLKLNGKDFDFEEGGDHKASFLFSYKDHQERFEILINFSVENRQIDRWDILVHGSNVSYEIIADKLNVPDKLLNWDIDYDS